MPTAAIAPQAPVTALIPEYRARRADNAVWFEIPVSNINGAIHFYETVFATDLKIDPRFPGLAIFPRSTSESVTGALIEIGDNAPSTDGTVVYLNCDGDLDGVLKRAQGFGATILKEVAQLPGNMGWIAQFRDLDGNRVGLHASF
jgi:predicted enzyme related to lactoylglutathione lyase